MSDETRRIENLEHVVFGNGRNALRADIDQNARDIADMKAATKERRAQTFALFALIVGQLIAIAKLMFG